MTIVPTSEPTPGSALDGPLSELLTRLGFEASWPVYQHRDEYEGVTIESLRDAVFASSYTAPRVLPLQACIPNATGNQDVAFVSMLVETVTQVYVDLPNDEGRFAEPLRPRDYPHFYVGGVLYNNSHHRRPGHVRMHAYLDFITPEAISAIYIQLVPDTAETEIIDAPLCWAEVTPGELVAL